MLCYFKYCASSLRELRVTKQPKQSIKQYSGLLRLTARNDA